MSTKLPSALAFLVGWCALSPGCRTEQNVSAWTWADVDALVSKPVDIEDAPAIVVLREHKLLFQLLGSDARSEVHTHEVLQLLTEAAFDRAQVRIFWPKKGKLLHLDARSIAPDGTITPLDATQLFASEVTVDSGGSGRDKKKEEIEARFFQFPRVEVGSFIELAYTTELPGLYGSWSERVVDDLPILEYRVELTVDDYAETDLRILNSDVKPTVVKNGNLKTLTFTMRDIPPAVTEAYAPAWRTREPWWIYRTVAYRPPNQLWYINGDWDDVTKHLVGTFKGKGLEGAPHADVSACNPPGDPICTVTKATELVRSMTAFTGFDAVFSHRDVSDIVNTKTASASDKALLLYAVLKNAGVDARLAAVARRGTNEVPREFPSLTWLNHTLVVAVFGKQALWIDPSCEHCTPSFMPSWVPIGEPALVVWSKDTARGKEHVVDWWTVAGQPMPTENLETRTYTVSIEPDGDAKVVIDEKRVGEPALFWRAATRNDDEDDRRRDARRVALALSRAALLDKWEAVKCDPVKAECKRRLEATLPRFAYLGPDGVWVPLQVLRNVFNVHDDEDEPRKTDVVVQTPWRGVDELRLIPPAGKKIARVPDGWQESGPLVDIAVTTRMDDKGTLVVRRDTRLSAGKLPKAELAEIERVLNKGSALTSSMVKLVSAN